MTPLSQKEAELFARQLLRFQSHYRENNVNFKLEDKSLDICKALWPGDIKAKPIGQTERGLPHFFIGES